MMSLLVLFSFQNDYRLQTFRQIAFTNPTFEQLYQWNTGDVYEYYSCDGFSEYSMQKCDPAKKFDYDSITAVTTTPGEVQYTYAGWENNINYPIIFGASNLYITNANGGTLTYSNVAQLLDTTLMPEEYNSSTLNYYFPNDSSYCLKAPVYAYNNNYVRGSTYYPPLAQPTS